MKDVVDYINNLNRPLSGGTGNRDIMESYDDDEFYDRMLQREFIDEEWENEFEDSDLKILKEFESEICDE